MISCTIVTLYIYQIHYSLLMNPTNISKWTYKRFFWTDDGSISLHNHHSDLIQFPFFYYTLMKISQKIQQSAKDDKIWWSFEYFPPRTAQVKKKTVYYFFQPHMSLRFLGSAKSFRPYRAHASTWA